MNILDRITRRYLHEDTEGRLDVVTPKVPRDLGVAAVGSALGTLLSEQLDFPNLVSRVGWTMTMVSAGCAAVTAAMVRFNPQESETTGGVAQTGEVDG